MLAIVTRRNFRLLRLLARLQCTWEEPHVAATNNKLLNYAQDNQTTARLLAVSCPESGAWLNALPVAALGLRISDDVIRVAAGLRLGYHSASLIMVPTAEHVLSSLVHMVLAPCHPEPG